MSLSRREFIRNLSIAGGGLTLGFSLSAPGNANSEGDFEPNAFLRISTDGEVTVQIHKVEMGQGTVTGLITLIAEELEVEPGSVRYEMAAVDKAFRDPEYYLQITGGSNAIRVNYLPLRQVGATAKTMLLSAASKIQSIPITDLYCENGAVKSRDGKAVFPYRQLVATASSLSIPKKPALKDAADFKYIGTHNSRLDNQPKVSGRASFGIDAPNPESLVAVVVRPPVAAGSLSSFDGDKALAMPGVHSVFAIAEGVAVVAENYWRARKAAERVDIQWHDSDSRLVDSDSIDEALSAALAKGDFARIRNDGKAPKGEPYQRIEANYSLPFLAHATMEPMNATVDPNSGEVWVGSQSPDIAQKFAAIGLGLDADEVTVHNQFLGGGFGRRAAPDHVLEAAQIARAVGKRVKLVWSREDDTRHDFYRPPMKSKLAARLDSDGRVESWCHHLAGPSLLQSFADSLSLGMVPGWVPDFLIDFGTNMVAKKDRSSVEGAKDIPYQFEHIEVGFKNVETPVRLGYWRSVGHSHTAFVVESFVDELAHAAGVDPLAFRLQNLPEDSRHREVLNEVARLSQWGNAPAGRFQGVAVHESFHSVVAEVVEISMLNGQPKPERAYCAIHCGQVVNPDIVRQQMESGVLFGLSAAMKGEITLKAGAVQQSNFHDYPVLRMNEVPTVEVAIIDSDGPPTGVGEPATPPAPAALGNAIFAASGQRLRDLPFKLA